MKRDYRLLKKEDYTDTIQNGKTITSKSYVIHYKEKSGANHLRIGVTTSTKTGHAVVRNKVKRQVKAMLDYKVDLTREYDIVIIIKKNFLNFDYQTNSQILYDSLSQIERLLK